jgi:uncharacterized protein
MSLIDTNINLFRWPFRRLPLDETSALVARLRKHDVTEAWAGSYEALLHRDLSALNERLVQACRAHEILKPVGALNLSVPDWEEDLRRSAEDYEMHAVRVHPNFHGYELTDPRFSKLFRECADRGLVLQIAVMMEEERTQHPLVKVSHVNTAPLIELVKQTPKARVILQNCFRAVRGRLLLELAASERVWFDISTLEGMAGIEKILKLLPANRLIFGSAAPLYTLESAVLKLRESTLSRAQMTSLSSGAAQTLR